MHTLMMAVLRACTAAIPFAAALAAAVTPPSRFGLCAACHGVHGHVSIPGVTNLTGQHEGYFRVALRQYRNGRRNVAAMRAEAGALNDQPPDALAAWHRRQAPLAQAQP